MSGATAHNEEADVKLHRPEEAPPAAGQSGLDMEGKMGMQTESSLDQSVLGDLRIETTYAGLDDETLDRLARQHGLAQHEITELMLAFSVLDVDGSGAVSVAELMEVVGTTQWRLTKQQVQQVVTEFDVDGNGLIDFEEFLTLIRSVVRRVHASLEEVIRILQMKCAARKPLEIVRVARYLERRIPFFATLRPSTVQLLAAKANVRQVAEGSPICIQDGVADSLLVLLSGHARVYRKKKTVTHQATPHIQASRVSIESLDPVENYNRSPDTAAQDIAAARAKALDDLAAATLSASAATGGLLLDCLAHAAAQSMEAGASPGNSLWQSAAHLVRSGMPMQPNQSPGDSKPTRMRLVALHADLPPPPESGLGALGKAASEPIAMPSPEDSGDTHALSSRFRRPDPFARLLTLTTPLQTHHVPGAHTVKASGNTRPVGGAVTVGGICGYLRRNSLQETSSAFLAAVATAAEGRRDALLQSELRAQPQPDAEAQREGEGGAGDDCAHGKASFLGRVMPGEMVLLRNRSLGRREAAQVSRMDSVEERAVHTQLARSSMVLPIARAASVLEDAESEAGESDLMAPVGAEGDGLADGDVEEALRTSGGVAGRSFLAAKAVLSERSSRLQAFTAIAFMPAAGKQAQATWGGARRALKAVQCAREALAGLSSSNNGAEAGRHGGDWAGAGGTDAAAVVPSVAAVTEHGALVARLALGDVIGERALHHGMRGGPVEPPGPMGRLVPLRRNSTVIAVEPCSVLEITAQHFQAVSQASSVSPYQAAHTAAIATKAPKHRTDLDISKLATELVRVPLLAGLDTAVLRKLAQEAHAEVHLPGSVLMRQGDHGDRMALLTRGTVRVLKIPEDEFVIAQSSGRWPAHVPPSLKALSAAPDGAAVEVPLAADADDVAAEDSALTFESSASCLHDVVDGDGAVVHRTYRARSTSFHGGAARSATPPSRVARARSFIVQKLEGQPPPRRRPPRSASKHAARGSWSIAGTARLKDQAKSLHLSVMLPSELGEGSPHGTPPPMLHAAAAVGSMDNTAARTAEAAAANTKQLLHHGNHVGVSDRRISFAVGLYNGAGHSRSSGDSVGDWKDLEGLDGAASLMTMLPGEQGGQHAIGARHGSSSLTEGHAVRATWAGGAVGRGTTDYDDPPAAPRGERAATMRISERYGRGCRGMRQALVVVDVADVPHRLRRPSGSLEASPLPSLESDNSTDRPQASHQSHRPSRAHEAARAAKTVIKTVWHLGKETDGRAGKRDTTAAPTPHSPAAAVEPDTLRGRVEYAIDTHGGALPLAAIQRRDRLAAAAQRTLVDILKTVFGKGDDVAAAGRRNEQPPLTENEVDRLQDLYGKCVRVVTAYACLGEMALMELHATNRRAASAIATEESHTIVVPKALYDAVLRTKHSAEMRAKFRIFAHIDWLAALPDVDKKNVGYAMELKLWPQGSVVASRGSELQGVMLLRRGQVAILRGTGAGEGGAGAGVRRAAEEMDVVGRRWAGDMFGEQALLHGGVHPHTIIAETPLEAFCLSVSDMSFLGRAGITRLVRAACKLAPRLESPKPLSWQECASDQQAGLRHANTFLHYLMDSGAYAPARAMKGQRYPAGDAGPLGNASAARSALMRAPGVRRPLLQPFDRRLVNEAWRKATTERQVPEELRRLREVLAAENTASPAKMQLAQHFHPDTRVCLTCTGVRQPQASDSSAQGEAASSEQQHRITAVVRRCKCSLSRSGSKAQRHRVDTAYQSGAAVKSSCATSRQVPQMPHNAGQSHMSDVACGAVSGVQWVRGRALHSHRMAETRGELGTPQARGYVQGAWCANGQEDARGCWSTTIARLSPEMCTREESPTKQTAVVQSLLEDVELSAITTSSCCIR
eukprot:jgi/Ulvmu1/163/UM001_0167.1